MSQTMPSSVYDFTAKNSRGEDQPLTHYRGKLLLVVNVASQCGFTPQYEGLQSMYEKYQALGLEILGFPCNQFGGQEPGSESEIESFCVGQFGVKFPIFAKLEVNGANEHPLFTYLKKSAPGVLGTEAIKWNFTKFLVDRQGHVMKRYGSIDKPEKIEKDVCSLLAASTEPGA